MKTRFDPFRFFIMIIFAGLALGACASQPDLPPAQPEQNIPAPVRETEPEQEGAEIANPAAVNCMDKGHEYEIRTAEDGSQSGVCIFDDGSECDEWAFMREECGSGSGTPVPVKAGSSEEEQSPAVVAAKELLASELAIDPEEITLKSLNEKDWPDACLGLAAADEMCAQVILPGYQVVLTAGGQEYIVRASQAGDVVKLKK